MSERTSERPSTYGVNGDLLRVFPVKGLVSEPRFVPGRPRIQPKQIDGPAMLVAHFELKTVLFQTEFHVHFEKRVIPEWVGIKKR